VASVDFYGCLAGSNFRGNLLLEHSGNDESHNLPLSRSQILDLDLPFLRTAVMLETVLNRVQQIQIPERFAPDFSARTDIGMSPCAVTKMMGICMPASANRR
jgi:hypothetical protein